MPRVESDSVSLPGGRPAFNPDTDGDGAFITSQQWRDVWTNPTENDVPVIARDTGDSDSV